jgi:hypothetical protein
LDGSQRIGFEYRQVGIEQTLFQLGAFASAADIAATSGSGDRVGLSRRLGDPLRSPLLRALPAGRRGQAQ